MAEEDIANTAIRCPMAIELYKWVVMTFGLKNERATKPASHELYFT